MNNREFAILKIYHDLKEIPWHELRDKYTVGTDFMGWAENINDVQMIVGKINNKLEDYKFIERVPRNIKIDQTSKITEKGEDAYNTYIANYSIARHSMEDHVYKLLEIIFSIYNRPTYFDEVFKTYTNILPEHKFRDANDKLIRDSYIYLDSDEHGQIIRFTGRGEIEYGNEKNRRERENIKPIYKTINVINSTQTRSTCDFRTFFTLSSLRCFVLPPLKNTPVIPRYTCNIPCYT